MRTRHATALSIAGVLAAGLVAALVNAHALAGSGGRAATSLASTHFDASSSVSAPVTVVSTAASTTDAIPTPASASRVNSGPLLFAVGAAGTVTLEDLDGVLDVVAVAPAGGWSVSAMTPVDAGTVVVDFVSADTLVRATAMLRGSQITVQLTDTPDASAPATAVVTQTTATVPTSSPPAPLPLATSAPSTPATPRPSTTVRPPTTSTVPTTAPSDDDSSGHGSDDSAGHDGYPPDD